MRNFKKLIAMGTALAMAIIMNVSAFAAAGDTAEEPITDAYANGAVVVSAIKAALPTMTEGAQYTVVVVPVGEEISDSNIHYINQADGADAIWAEGTTWGTPEDLEDAEAGTYVVRVGDEAGHVDEIYFRVGSTEEPPAADPVPVVTFMNGTTTVATVDTVDGKATLPADPTLAKVDGYVATAYEFVEWVTDAGTVFTADTVVETDTTVYPKFKAQIYKSSGNKDLVYGDVTADGVVNAMDRTCIHQLVANQKQLQKTNLQVSPLLYNKAGTKLMVAGDVTGEATVNAMDRTCVHQLVANQKQLQNTNKLIYVVNK